MLKFLKDLFVGHEPESAEADREADAADLARQVDADIPRVGDIRVMRDDLQGPWPVAANAIRAEVIDVREGWVRYKWLGDYPARQDERRTIKNFNIGWVPDPKP